MFSSCCHHSVNLSSIIWIDIDINFIKNSLVDDIDKRFTKLNLFTLAFPFCFNKISFNWFFHLFLMILMSIYLFSGDGRQAFVLNWLLFVSYFWAMEVFVDQNWMIFFGLVECFARRMLKWKKILRSIRFNWLYWWLYCDNDMIICFV